MEIQEAIAQHCGRYYDGRVFGSAMGNEMVGLDTGQDRDVSDVVKHMLGMADSVSRGVDIDAFRCEVQALHLELYAFAWFKQFRSEEHNVSQATTTKDYLSSSGNEHLWDMKGEYNRVLSMSTKLDGRGERLSQEQIARANVQRYTFWKKWADGSVKDPANLTNEEKSTMQCVARVANRLEVDLKKHDWSAGKMLVAKFLDQFGWADKANQDAMGILVHTVRLLYEDSEADLKKLRL